MQTNSNVNNPASCVDTSNGPDIKGALISTFKSCLDILRTDGLTGEKALRNLSYLLILKLIERHFGGEIDIDGYDYGYHESDELKAELQKILRITRFSVLATIPENSLPNNMACIWDGVLSVHPATKNIFLAGKAFDIQHQATFKKLIDKLNAIDLSQTGYDVLGNAYEEVIKDIMTGKVFGQFFTQPVVKKLMVNLIDPQIHPDGTIESCGDPTMGTGGFLITYLQHILKQAADKNIQPDWEFIKREGLYGKEIEPDTYQLAVSNMLISSGHMFDHLDRGDSIRVPITRKFDNVLANPPFGIKGLKYDDFQSSIKMECTPIKTDNAVSLFIQAIIYMLKINGKCAVVLPDGVDLFSKKNATLISIREYLMKTCDLKEIIYLPTGIFTYTSIKTCVFYFVKKREGVDVVASQIKLTKTHKETGRTYTFVREHATTNVCFYDYTADMETKTLLVDVPIDVIAGNSYSLNYAEYTTAEEVQYGDGVVVKSIQEIFKFNTGSLQAMKCDESNMYPVISSSNIHSHSSFALDGENLFILKIFDGSAGKTYSTKIKYFNGKCNFTSLLYHMVPIDKTLFMTKYMYYYLSNNIEFISKTYQKGSCNKSLDLELFLQYKIPIPPLDKQQMIVTYLDFIYEKAIKTSTDKIAELKHLNQICLRSHLMFDVTEVKTLDEVCSIEYGTRIVKKNNIEGEYPVYGSGRAMFSTSTFNRNGFTILIGRFALSPRCVRLVNKQLFLNDSGFSVTPTTEMLMHKYVGYYLLHNQNEVYACARGTAQKNLEMDAFKLIKIPIPPLDKQQEIVDYCEYNDTLIQQLEKEIENNKRLALQFITNVVNIHEQNFKEVGMIKESYNPDEDPEIPIAEFDPQPEILLNMKHP